MKYAVGFRETPFKLTFVVPGEYFRRALAHEPLRHTARIVQFQFRWFETRRMKSERALSAAVRTDHSCFVVAAQLQVL